MNNRGYAVALFIVLGLFVVTPFLFWFFTSKESKDSNVRGITTNQRENGTSIYINSDNGSWNLHVFVCESEDDCLLSLDFGKNLSIVGGGIVQNHEVFIGFSSEWKDYEYLKVYVVPGWGSMGVSYKITNIGSVPNTVVEEIEVGGVSYNVLLIPLKEISNRFVSSATFSDN